MSKSPRRSAWQLPKGVSAGTWDYAESESIASEYDDYFRNHGMFALDQQVLSQYFEPGRDVIDLGCGSGRALVPLVERGLRGVAFDLSQHMLETVRDKPELKSAACIRGNLVDLDCFRDASFDYAMCLFSTLGMVRGSDSRSRTVEHVARILKPDGLFVLQVHNYWVHLFDPEGPMWMLRNFVRANTKRDVELGDRFFNYRGIPEMYLHSFRLGEIRNLLTSHAFEIIEKIPLNARQDAKIAGSWLLSSIRASGWIFIARKKGSKQATG